MQDTLQTLYEVVKSRKETPQEGSYTCYLFGKGLDKILKKCGEECSEVIIAAKNGKAEDTAVSYTHLVVTLHNKTAKKLIDYNSLACYYSSTLK